MLVAFASEWTKINIVAFINVFSTFYISTRSYKEIWAELNSTCWLRSSASFKISMKYVQFARK